MKRARTPRTEIRHDEAQDVDVIVRDTLTDVTPRSATLALMRFSDYLELIQLAGIEPTGELCSALFAELRGICLRGALDPAPLIDELF